MKIKHIKDQNTKVWFTFACSQCEAEVDREDRFCHNCGHKLSALPREVKMQKAANILTDALRKEPVAPAKTDEADAPDIGSGCTSGIATTVPDVMKGWVVRGKENQQ